jgi:tripartite-type tricarboxylate transporter receptor subunit TctC
MKLPRRTFLHLAVGAAGLPAVVRIAQAETYPSRPVHWIVGFAPSGGNDIVARIMGQWLSERLGQPFIIENRPGAASNLATDVVAHASPDGYSLLLVSVNNASSATLYDKLNFDFIRDIAPVAGICFNPLVMVINPSVPAKTVPEFIAYARANSGKVNMGSAGTGGIGHLAGELLNMLAGINMVHVPFRGNGPALTALLGGQVDILFPSLASSAEFIRTGKLRGLAVTTAMRSDALPDLPTVGQFVPGYEISTWYGIGAPIGTPADVIDKIHTEIDAGLADSKIKGQFAELGDVAMPMSPAAFGKFIADEIEKCGKVIRTANIKPE